ncbi:MAG TPA: MgtC/SapB family protein, partial [Vicinamibacteria bacterium]
MSGPTLFYRFGTALAIGFLVGLQREFSYRKAQAPSSAGVRTFTLLSLSGCAAALVAETAKSP